MKNKDRALTTLLIVSLIAISLVVISTAAVILSRKAATPGLKKPDPVCKGTDCFKPVIYLYGYEGQDVNVNLSVDGLITMSYPRLNNGEWAAKVDNNGNILVDNKPYRYLFWEGELNFTPTFKKGYCVSGSQIESFLESKLDEMGFNTQEKQDFITYWAPRMKKNTYNVISFQTTSYTKAAKLDVSPKPDRTIRVFMAYYPSETSVTIPEQTFKVPKRKGKVVVEWGGTEVTPESIIAGVQQSITGDVAVTQDPYMQYGVYSSCARDWDSCSISNTMGKWSVLDEKTKGEAWYHWQHYGKAGW